MGTSIYRDKKDIGHVKGGGRTFCSAVNCSNSKYSHPQLSFFRFPHNKKRYVKFSMLIADLKCKLLLYEFKQSEIVKFLAINKFSQSSTCYLLY